MYYLVEFYDNCFRVYHEKRVQFLDPNLNTVRVSDKGKFLGKVVYCNKNQTLVHAVARDLQSKSLYLNLEKLDIDLEKLDIDLEKRDVDLEKLDVALDNSYVDTPVSARHLTTQVSRKCLLKPRNLLKEIREADQRLFNRARSNSEGNPERGYGKYIKSLTTNGTNQRNETEFEGNPTNLQTTSFEGTEVHVTPSLLEQTERAELQTGQKAPNISEIVEPLHHNGNDWENLEIIFIDDPNSTESITNTLETLILPSQQQGALPACETELLHEIISFENPESITNLSEIQIVQPHQDASHSTKKLKPLAKSHCCYFCEKVITNLRKHLKRCHREEPMVKEALSVAAQSSRKTHNGFNRLRKLGDEKFNMINPNDPIVVRKSSTAQQKYVLCPECNGYYSEKNFRKHIFYSKTHEHVPIGVARIQTLRHMLGHASVEMLEIILPFLRSGPQKDVILNDPVIIAWGNVACRAYLQRYQKKVMGQNQESLGIVRAQNDSYIGISADLRLLADLVLEAKKLDTSVEYLDDLFHTDKQDVLFQSIDNRTGFDGSNYRAPTVATTACTLLKKVLGELRCSAMKHNRDEMKKRYEEILFIITTRQNKRITKRASENRTAIQRRKPQFLPSTSQIKTLLEILDHEIFKAYNDIKNEFSLVAYSHLMKLLSAKIMCFNRKRPGDIQKMLREEFSNCQGVDDQCLVGLSSEQRSILANLKRIITRHKLNQSHAILITAKEQEMIQFVLDNRNKMWEFSHNDKFVFANVKSKRGPFFRADLALKDICKKNNLDGDLLSATKLRKHLATCTATVSNAEQDLISDFMGHSKSVHQNIYQIRQTQTDVTVVGRLLYDANGSCLGDEPVTIQINEKTRTPSCNSNWLDADERNCNNPDNLEDRFSDGSEYVPEDNPDNLEDYSSDISENSIPNDYTESVKNKNKTCKNLSKTKKKSAKYKAMSSKSKMEGSFSVNMVDNDPCPRKRMKRFTLDELRKPNRSWNTPQKQKIRTLFQTFIDEREVPGIHQIQMSLEDLDVGKSLTQIQTWLRSEITRQKIIEEGKSINRWTTPQRHSLRERFKSYYDQIESERSYSYPSKAEFEEALRIPDFKGKSVEQMRSKLQHDFSRKLLELKKLDLQNDSSYADI